MANVRYDRLHASGNRGNHLPNLSPFPPEALVQTSLSVVVPARNEAASLPQLVLEIRQACQSLCLEASSQGPRPLNQFEITIVDDNSTDNSHRLLDNLAAEIPELRVIRLATRTGQSGALLAGIRASSGDWIAMIDADLQNDPADFRLLWNSLGSHEAVLGWRMRREDSWSRRMISRIANRVRNWVLGQSIRDTGCSLRIVQRDVLLQLPWFQGVHRFFGPLLLRQGCQIVQVPVSHRPRVHGQSHYNIWNRSLQVVLDLIGVAWLMRRSICVEIGHMDAPASRQSPHPHAQPEATVRSRQRVVEYQGLKS